MFQSGSGFHLFGVLKAYESNMRTVNTKTVLAPCATVVKEIFMSAFVELCTAYFR